MSELLPNVPEFSAAEIVRKIETGEPFQVMDVRAPERVARGRIDLVPPERFHNIRGSELMHSTSVEDTGLDPDVPVVVVCGAGRDSAVLAFHLGRMGLDARSLRGGLAEWFNALIPRELDPPQGISRLIQFDRIGKGCLGYLLLSADEAVIVDPPFHAGPYLSVVDDAGATLVGVVDTHAHADYVSGAASLATTLGVPYYLHPADAIDPYDGREGQIDFQALGHGDEIPLGDSALTVFHTPGHTEGSVTLLVEGRVALTGDFLFVESIGRPDLAGREAEWASDLWDSVQRAKEAWHPGMVVYPAHYAGPSERRMGRAVGIAFQDLLEENPLLGIADREAFVQAILDRRDSFPDVYRTIKAVNLGLAPLSEVDVDALEVGRNECALAGG